MGLFFNKQDSGVRLKDIQKDQKLRSLMNPLATILGSADTDNDFSMKEKSKSRTLNLVEEVAKATGVSKSLVYKVVNRMTRNYTM
jgi:hypothetical protein